jgi:hypothetical protein
MRGKIFLLTSAVLCASTATANAFSWSTQMNCASDYYAYCSMHTAGSAGCHACMRANRPKLSNSCVSSLIDEGILPKANSAQQKAKIAVAATKAKAASRMTSRPAANPVAKASSAKVVAARTTPKAASSDANVEVAVPTQTLPRADTPPHQASEATPAIDQQTIEALMNRAPYFLPTEDLASMFALTGENASPQPPSTTR